MANEKLTVKQERFVQGLFAGLSQREAYKSAYNAVNMKDSTIDTRACLLAKESKISKRLQELQDELKERNMVTAEKVLERWWDIATADPNELMALRRNNCRCCHGLDHKYQWIDANEYNAAVQKARLQAQMEDARTKAEPGTTKPVIPSKAGGFGFNKLAAPNPECPACMGEGIPEIIFRDTEKLGSKAKLLYAGLKQTKDGLEVKLQDQGKALENIARTLGMFKESLDVTIKKKLEDFMK